jgi:DNA-binding NarL/FixJ family response regulator
MSESPAAKPKVLSAGACHFALIEDDSLLRDLLSEALHRRFQPAALHGFGDGRTGLAHCLRENVDVLLTDLHLPDMDGREVVRELRARGRKPRIIVLTSHVDATLPAELVALGVAGFVDKATPLEHAVRAVERVLAGGMYFFAGVMPSAAGTTLRPGAMNSKSASLLSPREREIARLVAGGMSSKEIAQSLELSVRTVENYRAHLMQKIGVRDTASLVRWSLEHGLG